MGTWNNSQKNKNSRNDTPKTYVSGMRVPAELFLGSAHKERYVLQEDIIISFSLFAKSSQPAIIIFTETVHIKNQNFLP